MRAEPIECHDLQPALVALAYDEREPVSLELRAHVASCERCQTGLRRYRRVRRWYAMLPQLEPSRRSRRVLLRTARRNRVGRDGWTQRLLGPAFAAAAMILLLLATSMLLLQERDLVAPRSPREVKNTSQRDVTKPRPRRRAAQTTRLDRDPPAPPSKSLRTGGRLPKRSADVPLRASLSSAEAHQLRHALRLVQRQQILRAVTALTAMMAEGSPLAKVVAQIELARLRIRLGELDEARRLLMPLVKHPTHGAIAAELLRGL